MLTPGALVVAVLLLGLATLGLRLAGVLLAGRITLDEQIRGLVGRGTVVLICAVVAVSSIDLGSGRVAPALPLGVLVGAVLAWRQAPFVVVVVAAAGVTAALRAVGLG